MQLMAREISGFCPGQQFLNQFQWLVRQRQSGAAAAGWRNPELHQPKAAETSVFETGSHNLDYNHLSLTRFALTAGRVSLLLASANGSALISLVGLTAPAMPSSAPPPLLDSGYAGKVRFCCNGGIWFRVKAS